ncbi:hypothetical protein A2U01_0019028, partial [Trifolium medium]|nr:hypothetical protein [Trifolium medium]
MDHLPLISCMRKGGRVSIMHQFGGGIFGKREARRKGAGLVTILVAFSATQNAYISNMGIWDSNMWSWKLDWRIALDDEETESAIEMHQLLV